MLSHMWPNTACESRKRRKNPGGRHSDLGYSSRQRASCRSRALSCLVAKAQTLPAHVEFNPRKSRSETFGGSVGWKKNQRLRLFLLNAVT